MRTTQLGERMKPLSGDRDPRPLMTLTKQEYDRARNGDTPSTNGNAASVRHCEVCNKPLSATQKRACSSACGRTLGARATNKGPKTGSNGKAKSAHRLTPPTPRIEKADIVQVTEWAFLASLPDAVSAIEVAGWRCVRVQA
jgi:hypothetical protein